MIINVRGTSGSGKSTIVRNAMDLFSWRGPVHVKGRKQPLGYWLGPNQEEWALGVPGHYETACGGCDTLKGYDQAFELVEHAALSARHVLFEGVLISEEYRRTVDLAERFSLNVPIVQEVLVIQLTTPIDTCLGSIRSRREARGDVRELNPANTTNRVGTIERTCERLRRAGVTVEQHDRDSAMARVREILSEQ